MSKSYFEEPRRGPIALEPSCDPFEARGHTIPPSGPTDPRQRVRNDRRDPEPYRDLRVKPNLTGTWFERRGRYRLFINHVGGHLECLLTLVVKESGYHMERKSLAKDERLPFDWGIPGYLGRPPKRKLDPIAFRFAGDWVSNVYMLTVPVWLSEQRLEVSAGSVGTHDLGQLTPRAGGDELDVDLLGWFVRRWPDAKELFDLEDSGEGESPANLRTVARRESSQPVLLDRYLARPSVPYHVRTHYWFPLTPKQRKNLPKLAATIRYEQVFVDPDANYRPVAKGQGGKAMDIYDLLAAGRALGMGHDYTHARNNIVTAVDEIVSRVFERAYSTPPHEGGLGIDELVHLRPHVLRFLDDWCLAPSEDHGRQTLATALQRLVDRASWDKAEYSHLEKYLGITSRGWRGFEYEVEVTAYEVMEFDEESTQKSYETGKEVFDKLREQVEKQAKKHLPKLSKFKAVAKLLPLSYLVGHVRVKFVRVVEGDAGGPQDDPWEAYYGFALGGISMSKSAGSAGQSVKMSGTTVVRASTPPMKEELEGVLQYVEGSLFGGIGLGGDDEDKGVENPGMVLTKSMLTFYGGKQAPAVSFVFGAKLTDGLGGGEVGAQGLFGWTWLLDGGESRIAIEPKGAQEEQDFQSYWQDHVPSLAVHFPINGARLPVPTEAEQARMDEEGKISVKEALDAFAACELPLIAHPAARIEIDGYADAPGKKKYNQTLSEHRAESIFNYFESIMGEHYTKGLSAFDLALSGRIRLKGHGEPPKSDTATLEKFDPAERRSDIKISLATDDEGAESSIEWKLRRARD